MALALYRKYRPRTFAEVIGQEHVTEPLSQALRSGRLHHAYLFSGPRGCGKTSSARILARSLNCEQGPTPDPCGVCASCKSLANDGTGSIDVIEIDAASHGGVDDARELREKAFFAPAASRYKIYVIDEAHMVSPAGFNALLKLVEEPPDYVKFIFATTEPEKVLGTIRSRTHHYPFRLIPPAVLRPYLQRLAEAEGIHVEPAVFPLVVRAGAGSARDSLSVLDQLIAGAGPEGVGYARAVALLGVTDVALIDEMCDALAAGDGAAAYGTIDRVAEAGHDPRRFASDLLERFRDLIVMQQVPDAVSKGLIDGPAGQLDAMSAQATRLGPATLSRCADIVHNGLVEMRGTTAPRLLLELITARMLLPGADDSTGALLQRLERMERRLTLTADHEGVRAQPASQGSPPPAQPAAGESPGSPSSGPSAGSSSSGVSGGGGQSAARAAAAAAGRRAPASPDSDTDPEGEATETLAQPADEPVRQVAPQARRPESAPAAGPSAAQAAAAAVAGSSESSVAEPANDRPEVAGPAASAVMPDAPEEPGLEPVSGGAPGQLTAAAVREVWPEIITAVGRHSKKVAALASGATVRDLDGQTVVLIFRFPAHARMVSDQPQFIVDALYEALGGQWQIRCEVAGEAGDAGGGGSGAQGGGTRAGHSPGGVAGGGARGGGSAGSGSSARGAGTAPTPNGAATASAPATAVRSAPATAARSAPGAQPARRREAAASPAASSADDGDDWPEPVRPGGAAPGADHAPPVEPGPVGSKPATMPAETGTMPTTTSPPASSGPAQASSSPPPASAGPPAASSSPAPASSSPAAASSSPAPVSGLAAARAAAAGAARQAATRPAVAKPPGQTDPARANSWSDGLPTEEAPYDPEYDGPPGGGVAYQGFDPGDEPLDDVIDEKTARQSGEQQAVQLLQEAFGAEKISER